VDIQNGSSFMCAALQYLSDLFADYSTCLILAFTVERSIAVFVPLRFKDICTVWRSRFACTAIFFVLAIIIAPYHFLSMGLYPGYHVCTILPEYEALFSVVYGFELMILRIAPVFVIALLNGFITVRITKLTRAKNKRRAVTKQLIDAGTAKQKNRAKNEDRNLQLTAILILVSTSYIIFFIPVVVDFGLRKLAHSGVIEPSMSTLAIVGNLSKALYICGFAINFFLYTMSGRVFRGQLSNLLCPRLKRDMGEQSVGGKTMATTAPEASSAV